MSKFNFNLDALLRHRESLERQTQHKLALAQSKLVQLQSQLTEATSALRAAAARIAIDPAALGDHQRFIAAMSARSATLRRRLVECGHDRAAAHAAFASAARDRKAIQLLRDKELANWRKQTETKAQAALDEAATRTSVEYDSA